MISVVMITKDEEKAVEKVVKDIARSVPDAEILIVDSSRDRTPEIAQSLGVKVIRQYPPQGYGPALDLALRSAFGEVIVTLDCDNTYPVDTIPQWCKMIIEDGYDLIDCSRLKTKPVAMPWINYFANKGFAWFASLLFLKPLSDLHSGMRAYRKSMLETLRYDPQGAALPVELLLRVLKMKYKIKFVFINYHERLGLSTMRPCESAFWTLRRILRVRFS